jgi:glucan phosphorylase
MAKLKTVTRYVSELTPEMIEDGWVRSERTLEQNNKQTTIKEEVSWDEVCESVRNRWNEVGKTHEYINLSYSTFFIDFVKENYVLTPKYK